MKQRIQLSGGPPFGLKWTEKDTKLTQNERPFLSWTAVLDTRPTHETVAREFPGRCHVPTVAAIDNNSNTAHVPA